MIELSGFYKGHEYVTGTDRIQASINALEKNMGAKLEPLEELRRIASAAESRAKTAEEEAAAAKKEARFSKIVSLISISMSALSLLTQLLPWLIQLFS